MTDGMTVDDVIWGGGGAKSAEWAQVGSWVGGPIQNRPQMYQPTEYVKGAPAGSGKPRTTRDGKPVYGVRVDVQTSQRDPAVEGDDGVRRMHLDKWRQHAAIRDALKEAGVRQLEVGGELWVQWSGVDTESDGSTPAKLWVAKYRPPAGSAAGIVDPGPQFEQAPPDALTPGFAGPPPGGAPQTVHQTYAYQSPAGPPAQPPMQPQVPVSQPGPAWGAPTPAPPPAMPPAAPPAPAPMPAAAPPAQAAPQNVLTESVAAALRAQGVDTSAFTIVPG